MSYKKHRALTIVLLRHAKYFSLNARDENNGKNRIDECNLPQRFRHGETVCRCRQIFGQLMKISFFFLNFLDSSARNHESR